MTYLVRGRLEVDGSPLGGERALHAEEPHTRLTQVTGITGKQGVNEAIC